VILLGINEVIELAINYRLLLLQWLSLAIRRSSRSSSDCFAHLSKPPVCKESAMTEGFLPHVLMAHPGAVISQQITAVLTIDCPVLATSSPVQSTTIANGPY